MFWYAVATFVCSFLLTPCVARLMRYVGIVDHANRASRKIHQKTTPLGGGFAICISFLLGLILLYDSGLIGQVIKTQYLIGVCVGAGILMVGGLLDDRYVLSPGKQFIAPVLAAVAVIVAGVGPHEVTNPLGGVIHLDQIQFSLGTLGNVVVFADMMVFVWLMGVMFTTKLLDGLDGLVTGIVTIGGLLLYVLSREAIVYQPESEALALIFVGACLGFLMWNFHPAKIFLGEGGSLLTGFLLGSIAILSQGKIATTLLVLGIPILDIIRVLFLRFTRKQSLFEGDAEHLHFKLIHSGLSQRQAVLLFYAISFLLGIVTFSFQKNKDIVLVGTFVGVLILLIGLWFQKKEEQL